MTSPMTLEMACSHIVDCAHKTAPIDPSGEFFAVGTPAMRGNVIAYDQARRISRATFEAWTRRLRPERGDLLFAREAPVGPIVRVPASLNVAPGQRTVLLRPDPDVVDPEYLYYLLTSPTLQALIAEKTAGSTVSHLNVADVRALPLPTLPDLPEQRRITELLRALDDKIAANGMLVATADQLAATLTRAAVSTVLMPLGSLSQITMGSSPPGTSFNTAGAGTVFYQGVTDFGVRTPRNRLWTSSPIRIVEVGDILLSVRAPVGRTNLAAEATCVGRGLAGLRAIDGRQFTLFHLLRDIPEAWQPFEAEGTIFGSISKAQLHGIQVPRIRPGLEDELEDQLKALEARIIAATVEDVRLARLRDTLLPELMSGRLRVKDAERAIEEVV
jgi:type I restriction enzyme S subunit